MWPAGPQQALVIALLVSVLVPQACAPRGERAAPEAGPPNVLLYVVDTLRADGIGAFGNDLASTPNFDRFASEGMLFERAYANSSWTRASFASILTGLYPPRHGVETRDDALPASLDTLGDLLADHGYTTGFITTNPNVGSFFGFGSGFSHMIELYGRRDAGRVDSDELTTPSSDVSRRALEWIDAVPGPFLLVVLTIDPHAPYTPPVRFDRDAARYRGPMDGSLAALHDLRLAQADRERARALYDAEISFNDESFGVLVEGLRERGRLDGTIAIFTSDHGEEFWEYGRRGHGRSLSDEVLHVPLVIRHPASERVPAGTRVARSVQLVDLAATVLDLIGVPASLALDGRSLFGEPADESRVFASLDLDGRQLWSLQGQRHKLVRDRHVHSDRFFDLRAEEDGRRVRLPGGRGARLARRRLEAELDRLEADARESSSARARTREELPKQVENAMRALGYVD